MTTGLPPWSRASGVGQYGASETLHDYLDLGAPNVLDSVTAGEYAALAQAIAWIAATAPMFVLRITDNGTGSPPPVEAFSMVSGYATYTGNAPPSGFPAVAYVSTGVHTVTIASPYSDDAGVSGGFTANYVAAGGDDSSNEVARASGAGTSTITVTGTDWPSGAAASVTTLVEIG